MVTRFAVLSAAAAAILSGCGPKEPETFTGSAEVGKQCVEEAARSYQVTLDYITLDPLTRDPSGTHEYAYRGVARQSSGTEKVFLCRLDGEKAFVDIVTFAPG
jgi:hypothetical protein